MCGVGRAVCGVGRAVCGVGLGGWTKIAVRWATPMMPAGDRGPKLHGRRHLNGYRHRPPFQEGGAQMALQLEKG